MSIESKKGFPFEFNSSSCGICKAKCCRGVSGNIWVKSEDILKICGAVGVNQIDGTMFYFERRENRYSIKEIFDGTEYRCIFLNSDFRCSIYEVRPNQCRTFPFWDCFLADADSLFEECSGILRRASL